MEFYFKTRFGGKHREIGYRVTPDMDVRIISIAGVNVDRTGSPVTRSETIMKKLRRNAKVDYVRNMRERAGAKQ